MIITILAIITQYNFNSGLTASGKIPKVGMVASCDRTIPFGTKVEFGGKIYSVEDRTSRWIQKKYVNCFDVYNPASTNELLKIGKKLLPVEIIYENRN